MFVRHQLIFQDKFCKSFAKSCFFLNLKNVFRKGEKKPQICRILFDDGNMRAKKSDKFGDRPILSWQCSIPLWWFGWGSSDCCSREKRRHPGCVLCSQWPNTGDWIKQLIYCFLYLFWILVGRAKKYPLFRCCHLSASFMCAFILIV